MRLYSFEPTSSALSRVYMIKFLLHKFGGMHRHRPAPHFMERDIEAH